MKRATALRGPLLILLLAVGPGVNGAASPGMGDLLLNPPAREAVLLPVPDLDLSGAEPRAREAVASARAEVRTRLADPATPAHELAEAYGRLGGLYHVHEILAGARPAYANARRLDPRHFRWAYLDAWLAQGAGRLEHALAAYEDARAIDPDYPALALRLGEVLLESNRPEDAAVHLGRALEAPGLEAAAAFRLGQLALQRRDFVQAESWLRRTLETDPGAEAAYTALALAFRGQGQVDAAREALARGGARPPLAEDRLVRALEDLDTGARRHFLRGLLAVQEGRFADGAEAFGQGLAEDPDNLAARISHARALYLAGKRGEARSQLEAVLERRPGEPLANLLLGVLLETEGDTTAARQAYERSLAAQPGHPGASHHLGLLAFRGGDWRLAAERLTQAAARFPDNITARVLALVAESRAGGDWAEIAAALEAMMTEQPGHPLPRYALSRLRSAAADPKVRDPAQALAMAEALLLTSAIPPVHEALALAWAASGDTEAALAALEAAAAAYRRSGAEIFLPRLQAQRARLAAGNLPAQAWPEDDPVLVPPPPDPRGVFQEYPTPRPF
ncbi:tetratricopeptide repeat protein [Thioalkalivibrio sp.]|uniref:tetratricopeptide repeat protein n=1 Tax=Thioalkalivibrio sp. TaxID=2093813 RepID=UPI0039748AA3